MSRQTAHPQKRMDSHERSSAMNVKKLSGLLLTAALCCACLTACGGSGQPAKSEGSSAKTLEVSTIGEAMDLADDGSVQTAAYEDAYVYVFEQDGTYWQLTAAIDEKQYDKISNLDFSDEAYNDKLKELVSPLTVTNCKNLNESMLTEDEMSALIGKTGEDLLEDGWTTGAGYNLDDMEFYMDKGPFEYAVTFEAQEKLENTDDFDEVKAITPLKVKDVKFFSLGNSATDISDE